MIDLLYFISSNAGRALSPNDKEDQEDDFCNDDIYGQPK